MILGSRIDHVNADLGGRIDRVNDDLGGRIDRVNDRLDRARDDHEHGPPR